MSWVAVAIVAAGVGGALISSHASSKATSAQSSAASAANAEQQREYDTSRADYAPYRAAGVNALNDINGLLKNPTSVSSMPGYQFGLGQGTNAIQRSAAGAGGLYSGATLKALDRYGQDYAGTKLNEQFNRDAAIAGIGQVATNGTSMSGMNAANQIGNNLVGVGNAQAANALNQGNIWGNMGNQLSSYARNSNWNSGTTWTPPSGFYGGSGTTLYGDGYGPE